MSHAFLIQEKVPHLKGVITHAKSAQPHFIAIHFISNMQFANVSSFEAVLPKCPFVTKNSLISRIENHLCILPRINVISIFITKFRYTIHTVIERNNLKLHVSWEVRVSQNGYIF